MILEPYFGQVKILRTGNIFASIQSLKTTCLEIQRFYDIIVDESHHSSAGTYSAVSEYFTPQYILRLTATPERMDGRSILPYFDNRIAYEMRLWDAGSRDFVPFSIL